MSPLWWGLLSGLCTLATGLVVYFLMRSRMESELSRHREELATARATLKNAEDSTRRRAMDEFLADIRIEERHYTREHKVLFLTRKFMVRQERIFFRNIPLSDWVEKEMPIEEGADLEKLVQAMSVFSPELIAERAAISNRLPGKLLNNRFLSPS